MQIHFNDYIQENIPRALDSVTEDNIENYFLKVCQYIFGYLEGFVAGLKLENQVKKYKTKLCKEWHLFFYIS